MRRVRSPEGQEEAVMVRRSESSDARGIEQLVTPSARAVFGHVNVLRLLEKANLAVTLSTEREDVLAHASFLDFPAGDSVAACQWEHFLHSHFSAQTCTPVNTLFLHLFVAQEQFAADSLKEILRDSFHSAPDLDFICLLTSNSCTLGAALDQFFKPLQRLGDAAAEVCAFICKRTDHCERLHVRRARVEDYDAVMLLFEEEHMLLCASSQPDFLLDTIQGQDKENPTAVCETDNTIVGFLSVSTHIDLRTLTQNYELTLLKELRDDTRQTNEGRQSPAESPWEISSDVSQTINAFCVQLLLIHRNYESRSVDFLPYVFQLFPTLSFCIVSVPCQSQTSLLLHNFVLVPQRGGRQLDRNLYALHRDALQGVAVRPALEADRSDVCALVKDLNCNEYLLNDLERFYHFHSDSDGVPLQAFVAQLKGEVVGVVVIRDEQDMEYLRSHYNVENFIYFSHHGYEEHAQMLHFVFKRSLLPLSRHMLKEVLRLAHRSCIYLRLYPPHHSQNLCLHHLDFVYERSVPVRPRPQIFYPLEELDINVPSSQITQEQAPFALSLLSRKLSMEPKITVTTRIVVVGASDTGLSFLETLCFCPHLRFNSLTLVSTHGLHGNHSNEDFEFLSTSHAYSSSDLARIPFLSCVRVVEAKMVGINRSSKLLRVSSGERVPYDLLVLCTGLQYRKPAPKKAESIRSSRSLPEPCNFLTINDLHDGRAARQWLSDKFVKEEGDAIVYGNTVDALCSVNVLLRLGVCGSRIHLVLPPSPAPPHSSALLPDPAVWRAVLEALASAQVCVHLHCVLDQMHVDTASQRLTSVAFTTGGEPVHLHCGVFINLSNRGVDCDAFRSINESFLLFDGRLLINSSFLTSDTSIYAAGPLTRFSRLCGSLHRSHAHFSSTEVGQDLATTLLSLFEPTQEPVAVTDSEADEPLLKYTQAKVQGAKLPGGFFYLHVTKPSDSHPTQNTNEPKQKVVTGRAERGNYFSMTFDPYDCVHTITCVSLKSLPLCNYLSLYGKHRALLGLHTQTADVHDLYSFFTQRHLLPLFHDRFPDLEQELQHISKQSKDTRGRSHVGLEEDKVVAVRSRGVHFLSYNRNLLPMFATPHQQ